MGFEDRRRRVREQFKSFMAGNLTIMDIPYGERAQVLSAAIYAGALDKGLLKIEDLTPAVARDVALSFLKEAPWHDRDDAADKGTEVHHFAEHIALGTARFEDVPVELRDHVTQWLKMVKDFDLTFEATEFTVYNRTWGYAGTGDFMARSGKFPQWGLILGDYKTSKSGIWPDIALQLAALRYGEFIGLDDEELPMPRVDTCVGVQITADGYQVVPVQTNENVFKYFVQATRVARWTTSVSSTVLGEPVIV